MGLFKKILKDISPDLDLDKLVKKVGDVAEQLASKAEPASMESELAKSQSSYQPSYTEPAAEDVSGFSWGPRMPQEENQFNYPGTYVQYFNHVFTEEFPGYQISYEAAAKRPATIFTFRRDGRTALIVELMSDRSEAKKLRRECEANRIPYLRFYYDHEGWWNTRTYVVTRTRGALQG